MDIQQTSTTNKTEGMSDTQHANKRSHGDTDTSAITSGAMSHTFLLKTVDVRVLGGFQKL